jgi:hypothetical protein
VRRAYKALWQAECARHARTAQTLRQHRAYLASLRGVLAARGARVLRLVANAETDGVQYSDYYPLSPLDYRCVEAAMMGEARIGVYDVSDDHVILRWRGRPIVSDDAWEDL